MWLFKTVDHKFVVNRNMTYRLCPEVFMSEYNYFPFVVFDADKIDAWRSYLETQLETELTIFKIELMEYE